MTDTNFESGFKVGDMLTKTPSTYDEKTMGRAGIQNMFTDNKKHRDHQFFSYISLKNEAIAANSEEYVRKLDMGRFDRKMRLRKATKKRRVSSNFQQWRR